MKTRIAFVCLGIVVNLTLVLKAQIPTNGLIGFYPFNGNANDESGNEHNGIVHGATLTTDRFGRPNSAYYFDGIDDDIEIQQFNSIPIGNQPRTVALWIYTFQDSWGKDLHTVFEYGDDIPYQTFGIDMDYYPIIQFYSWVYDIYCNTNAPQEGWLFLTFSHDGGIMRAYVNGILMDSLDIVLQTTLTNIYIGCEEFTQYYLGKIDDICIYNRVLTTHEISGLYHENIAYIIGDTEVCQGQENVAYEVLGMDSIINYSWDYSGTGATIIGNSDSIVINYANYATSGNLTVLGNKIEGHGTDTAVISITVNPLPLNAGTIIGDNIVCLGQNEVNYHILPIDNASNYIWNYSGNGATIIGNSESIVINFAQNAISGNLTVYGNNLCGSGTISLPLSIAVENCDSVPSDLFNIPNSFSPNGDGINEVFFIRDLPANAELIIFDRSGRKIYTSNNYQNDWNGKSNEGQLLESGTYWYVLSLPGFPTEFKGFVYIKR